MKVFTVILLVALVAIIKAQNPRIPHDHGDRGDNQNDRDQGRRNKNGANADSPPGLPSSFKLQGHNQNFGNKQQPPWPMTQPPIGSMPPVNNQPIPEYGQLIAPL